MKTQFLNQSGQAFIFALIVLVVVVIGVLAVISGSYTFKSNTKYNLNKLDAANLAEGGIDKAVAALNASGGSYNGETETSLGDGTYSVAITSVDASTKKVVATGYIPNKTNPKTTKTIEVLVTKGVGVSFTYGLQVGQGGLDLGSNAVLNGSVYSNGNITSSSGVRFNGDTYVAGGIQPTANQVSECVDPNCGDYTFGQSSPNLDVGQSFKPSTSGVLNKIALKLKKVGSPSNITVRIFGDSGGNPNKNSQLASASIAASIVTTEYGFVEVAFGSPPNLVADTTYWIFIDTSANSSNYWKWSSDTIQSYTRGSAKYTSNYQSTPTTWNNIGADLGFKTYMGGVATSISLGSNTIITGNVHANTITGASGVNVNGEAYYQSISSTNVHGSSCPNSYCHPGSADPGQVAMPISDANITEWKNGAQSGGVTNGNITHGSDCKITLGPVKITGNVTVGSNCIVTLKAPVWIQGNLTAGSGAIFKLDSTYGAASGMLIVDGTVIFGSNVDLKGSGTSGSYLTLLATTTGSLTMGSGAFSGIIYAPYGTVNLGSNASFKELVANRVTLGSGAVLNYDSGLSSLVFTSGPSGSFTVVKGSFQSE